MPVDRKLSEKPEPAIVLSNEWNAIVNEHDEVIRTEQRIKGKAGRARKEELLKKGEFYRCVYVFFIDFKKGEIIFQKRSEKSNNPLTYCATAQGHVKKHQSYLQAGLQETEEEVGIKLKKNDLKLAARIYGKKDKHPFYNVYIVHFNGKKSVFTPGFEEVHSLKRFTIEEMDKKMRQRKVPQVGKRFKYMWFTYVREIVKDYIQTQKAFERNTREIRKLSRSKA